ncbi:MAG: hypothetical protein EZS26_000210 [Candidatus Ordinivivax streblomastigis]|uniref:Uncharacterized protein n=1 Tax=Candidatus Ordinivivax streblomastigis TaxID=2540710 RepID=A0A5M8P558_9BACT|nr:MAG: hypothetical protein EZS26_000210 [Candidatus Ordinivivax streblomastigis]
MKTLFFNSTAESPANAGFCFPCRNSRVGGGGKSLIHNDLHHSFCLHSLLHSVYPSCIYQPQPVYNGVRLFLCPRLPQGSGRPATLPEPPAALSGTSERAAEPSILPAGTSASLLEPSARLAETPESSAEPSASPAGEIAATNRSNLFIYSLLNNKFLWQI